VGSSIEIRPLENSYRVAQSLLTAGWRRHNNSPRLQGKHIVYTTIRATLYM